MRATIAAGGLAALAVLLQLGLHSQAAAAESRKSRLGGLSAEQLANTRVLSLKEASAGIKLHHNKCVKCHKPYTPAAYDPDEWSSWMVKMSKKAKLKSDQTELLNKVFDASRQLPADASGEARK